MNSADDILDSAELLELNRGIFAAVRGGIVHVRADGAVLNANAEAQKILGLSFDELSRRFVADFGTATFREDGSPCPVPEYPVSRCLQTGESQPAMVIGVQRPGRDIAWAVFTAVPLHDCRSGALTGAVVTFIDITERKLAEERLKESLVERQHLLSQRLESLGVLSGGIAHDFNNLLTVILGRISVARAYLAETGPAAESLAAAAQACGRAQELTRQLLTFARGGSPVREAASIEQLVREAGKFAVCGSGCHCELSVSDDLWPAEVDSGQIFQVLNNLIRNADQAMPQGGVVELLADNVQLAGAGHDALPDGRYVCLRVRDRGVGIAPEHLGRIFDPYFTTKESGTGLGLAIAYSIVRKHGGHIAATSALGQGTEVTVYLPAAHAPVPAAAAVPAAAHRPRRGARVLVMEDDKDVRELLADALRLLGYEAEPVRDGSEALLRYRLAREAGRPFDVVLMDLTIAGGMGGKETIRQLLRLDPGVRAIVSSGYSKDPVMSEHVAHGFRAVMSKPYDMDRLRCVLESVLSQD